MDCLSKIKLYVKKYIIIKLKYLQCTRHLMCWHGGATLAGHVYILMTFSELYNPATHYRDDKFLAKFKKDMPSLILINEYST